MERARRGRNTLVPRPMKISSVSSFQKRRQQDRNAFSSFFFFFSHCSTLLVNRDGTNLIGKSSEFPNPVFREQIQLDVDRSNSKLLPFSLVKLERYGDRFLSKGEGEKNLHLSKSNRVKRRKIRISTVFRESSFVHFSIEYTDISSKLSHEHATKCNFERIAASLRLRRVGTIN